MDIKTIDHIVLTVRDIKATLDFYQTILDMEVETFAEGRIALRFGSQKLNLHQQGNEFEPKAQSTLPGSMDLCFITETPLDEAMSQVRAIGAGDRCSQASPRDTAMTSVADILTQARYTGGGERSGNT